MISSKAWTGRPPNRPLLPFQIVWGAVHYSARGVAIHWGWNPPRDEGDWVWYHSLEIVVSRQTGKWHFIYF